MAIYLARVQDEIVWRVMDASKVTSKSLEVGNGGVIIRVSEEQAARIASLEEGPPYPPRIKTPDAT